jgi:hypothetical protein
VIIIIIIITTNIPMIQCLSAQIHSYHFIFKFLDIICLFLSFIRFLICFEIPLAHCVSQKHILLLLTCSFSLSIFYWHTLMEFKSSMKILFLSHIENSSQIRMEIFILFFFLFLFFACCEFNHGDRRLVSLWWQFEFSHSLTHSLILC